MYFSNMESSGTFVLVGDCDSSILDELKTKHNIVHLPLPAMSSPEARKRVEETGTNCHFFADMKTRYYAVSYSIYKINSHADALNWLDRANEEQVERLRAIAIVLPDDYSDTIDLDKFANSISRFTNVEKVLIVNQMNESTDNLITWCVKHRFEWIERNPLPENLVHYDTLSEVYGVSRLDQVLGTAEWPDRMKKERSVGQENEDKGIKQLKEQAAEELFRPIQEKDAEVEDKVADEVVNEDGTLSAETLQSLHEEVNDIIQFISKSSKLPKSARLREINCHEVKRALKKELDGKDVYSLKNAVNKLHDNVHSLTAGRTLLQKHENQTSVVTSTAEIENSTTVVFSTANEVLSSAMSHSLKDSSSYSETNAKACLNRPNQKQGTRKIMMEADITTSTSPIENPLDSLDLTNMSAELKQWQDGQAEAEQRDKPKSRQEYFAELEKQNEQVDSTGVSGIINAATSEAMLEFTTYFGNVKPVRDALQYAQRDQRAETAGAVAAAIFQSITVEEEGNAEIDLAAKKDA